MAGDAGLSVKERLALLQNNNDNKNPNLVGNLKNTSTPTNLPPKPPTQNAKPTPPFGLKPVAGTKPSTPSKPEGSGFAPKPLKPPVVGKDKVNGDDTASPFPKLKPVSAGIKSGANKPIAPALLPRKTDSSPDSGTVTMREKGDANNIEKDNGSSNRPLSVQERMAALKKKAGDGPADHGAKENTSGGGSGGGGVHSPTKSPTSPSFPPKPPGGLVSPVSSKTPPLPVKPNAGSNTTPLQNGGVPAPATPLKPSDIIKSINKAAENKVALRPKPPSDGTKTGGRKSSELFQRNSDGKRFRNVALDSVLSPHSSSPAPPKPPKLENVDLASFLKAYAEAKEAKINADAAKSSMPEGVEGEMDELYVEAESETVVVAKRGSVERAHSVRVSQIPEMTEEEEELYDDGFSTEPTSGGAPAEEYDDRSSAQQNVQQTIPEDPDEIYEPIEDEKSDVPESEPEPISPPPVSSPNPSEDNKKAKKDKEKGKKKDKGKDETNKKEEKEKRKKEEELKKLRAKFGLTEEDEKVGDGVVKADQKGGALFSKDLPVTQGEIIAILRMDNCPAGKWLGQSQAGKIGFVNSNNIEVATPTIRHLMGGIKTESQNGEDPEELYEPLPEEGEMDEIYEEV